MTARATVNPPKPLSNIPIGRSIASTLTGTAQLPTAYAIVYATELEAMWAMIVASTLRAR